MHGTDRTPEEEPLPVAGIQERMWLADRLEPGSGLYNVPMVWRVAPRLLPEALADALAGVVERHEILRSRFVRRGGALGTVVDPPWRPEPRHEDLRALPEQERDRRLAEVIESDARDPFDPEHGRSAAGLAAGPHRRRAGLLAVRPPSDLGRRVGGAVLRRPRPALPYGGGRRSGGVPGDAAPGTRRLHRPVRTRTRLSRAADLPQPGPRRTAAAGARSGPSGRRAGRRVRPPRGAAHRSRGDARRRRAACPGAPADGGAVVRGGVRGSGPAPGLGARAVRARHRAAAAGRRPARRRRRRVPLRRRSPGRGRPAVTGHRPERAAHRAGHRHGRALPRRVARRRGRRRRARRSAAVRRRAAPAAAGPAPRGRPRVRGAVGDRRASRRRTTRGAGQSGGRGRPARRVRRHPEPVLRPGGDGDRPAARPPRRGHPRRGRAAHQPAAAAAGRPRGHRVPRLGARRGHGPGRRPPPRCGPVRGRGPRRRPGQGHEPYGPVRRPVPVRPRGAVRRARRRRDRRGKSTTSTCTCARTAPGGSSTTAGTSTRNRWNGWPPTWSACWHRRSPSRAVPSATSTR